MNWADAPTEPGFYWLVHVYERSSDVVKMVEIRRLDTSPDGWYIAGRAKKLGLYTHALYYGPIRPPTPPSPAAMESIRRAKQRGKS